MWAIGVTTYALLCGSLPFFHKDKNKIPDIIKSGKFKFPSKFNQLLSNESKDFIKKLLNVNSEERMNAEQALNHPWIKSLVFWCVFFFTFHTNIMNLEMKALSDIKYIYTFGF